MASPYAASSSSQQDDTNSSDITASQEAAEYLKSLRVCSLIDLVGLVYRTALPMPIWALYFAADGPGAKVFPVIYLSYKIVNLSWKMQGAALAVFYYCNRSLVSEMK